VPAVAFTIDPSTALGKAAGRRLDGDDGDDGDDEVIIVHGQAAPSDTRRWTPSRLRREAPRADGLSGP
jgi:hypothetical protein